MTFLDLSKRDQEIAERTLPTEGTHLPGFYELHRDQIHIALAVAGTFVCLVDTLAVPAAITRGVHFHRRRVGEGMLEAGREGA